MHFKETYKQKHYRSEVMCLIAFLVFLGSVVFSVKNKLKMTPLLTELSFFSMQLFIILLLSILNQRELVTRPLRPPHII